MSHLRDRHLIKRDFELNIVSLNRSINQTLMKFKVFFRYNQNKRKLSID
jgi:hypothetical protein